MDIIKNLIKRQALKSQNIIKALERVKRRDFLLPGDEHLADADEPISIGHGQTNSQPFTVVFMLELLQPLPGDKVLDVGCGSGWTTALLSHLVGAKGKVFGLEILPELAKLARTNTAKYDLGQAEGAEILEGDGWMGLPERAPFDKILVSAAASQIPPELLRQLSVGGRLVMPVGETFGVQAILAVDKINKEKFSIKRHPGFVFVPLVKKDKL